MNWTTKNRREAKKDFRVRPTYISSSFQFQNITTERNLRNVHITHIDLDRLKEGFRIFNSLE